MRNLVRERSRRSSYRFVVMLCVTILVAGAVASCGCGEERGRVEELEGEVADLRQALEEANTHIRDAAGDIGMAQASIGSSYQELSDAVEMLTEPEEVPQP